MTCRSGDRSGPRGWVGLAVGLVLGLGGCGGGSPPAPGGVVRIEVAYPGTDAALVESAVLEPIEVAVSGLARVTGLRSIARTGGATIDVRFARGVDRLEAGAAVRAAIDGVRATLPPDIDSPAVVVGRSTRWFYATVPAARARAARFAVERLAGVGAVETCGEPRPTIAVALDPARLAARGVSADAVLAAIEGQNLTVPGGRLTVGDPTATIRAIGPARSVADLAGLVVDPRGGTLADVGTVRLADEPDCVAAADVPDAVVLRAGLRGPAEDEDRVRRAVAEAVRGAGGTPLALPITVGVVELATAGDGRPGAAPRWAQRSIEAVVLEPRGARHAIVLWPGHDPAARATATAVAALGSLPGVGAARWAVTSAPLLEATLVGRDVDVLRGQARAAVEALGGDGRIAAAGCTPCRTADAMHVDVDRTALARYGVSGSALADAIRWTRPRSVGTFELTNGTSVGLTLTVGDGDDVQRWADLPVATPSGPTIRIRDVATVRVGDTADEILRVDRQRAVVVWAQGRVGVSASTVRAALAKALPGATIAPADLDALAATAWSTR